MIIMINGAFGVGKTTVSLELLKLIENSILYDPEEIGFMLRNILPSEIQRKEANTGDFQDFDLWKEVTVYLALALISKYKKNLIVPMTIRNFEYFQYILEGFKEIDEQTYHFCLLADKTTIFDRLRVRGEAENNWCFQQTEKCIQAYQEHNFAEYIHTENKPIGTVVKEILDILRRSEEK